LTAAWLREPDYSHGFLVAPLALAFLWLRRDSFPGYCGRIAWLGLSLIAASIGLRYVGGLYYVDAVDGWSLPLWIGGVVWMLAGWRVLVWAAPSVAYLWFAVPLPYQVEHAFRMPLQKLAAKLSCFSLQSLGLPAFVEGNTIFLNNNQLEVEEACSGLRIFMTIAALAFAYIMLVRRSWWEKSILLLSTVPIALAVNAARIVATGLFYEFVSGEAAHKFAHDFAGWMMIPMAAVLFWMVLWYLSKLVYEVHPASVRDVLGRQAASA
jgi:exosortase